MMSLRLATSQPILATAGDGPLDGLDDGHGEGTPYAVLRALGLASLVLGATALGIYLGRELRQRYKFKRRTPYDFFAKAGDPIAVTEYGMGV